MSPFCMKLETCLRMAGLEYEIEEIHDPRSAPLGKLPFITDDGTTIHDTELIIDYLESHHGVSLDGHLTPEQKAIAHSFKTMMCEHYYWAILYNRWVGENWDEVKQAFFGHLPALVRSFVPGMIQKNMVAELKAQGMGRFEPHILYELANKDVKAAACYLGEKPYFMGEEPSRVDATIFGFLGNVLLPAMDSPLKEYASRFENLTAYVLRMQEQYFPEFHKP